MDIGARGKNPSVVKVMCFISFLFFFIQDNGQVKYAIKEMASNSVNCVRCIFCHYIFTNYCNLLHFWECTI